MIVKNIVKELVRTDRYHDVLNILGAICEDKSATYPIYPVGSFSNKGKLNNWVVGSVVRNEAKLLQLAILRRDEIAIELYYFPNLARYLELKTDTMLHNYAIEISHRSYPTISISLIRAYLILYSLVESWGNEEDGEWAIPDEWAKEKNEFFSTDVDIKIIG